MNRIALYSAGALSALLAAGIAPANAAGCHLGAPGHELKHILYLQFDNVHLRRDNPNVPSDLEQMPTLLHFLEQEGTLLTNHHTPLISHTAVDIVTSETGVYGEKFGFGVGNSFGFFDPSGNPHFQSSFAYWTDPVNEGTTASPVLVPEMVDQRGKVHPAPWVPFTRAGCDVGAFSLANIELENTGSDVNTVFGVPSAEATEVANARALPNTPANAKAKAKPAADFEGIAIHCAKGSKLCGGSANAKADMLNDEPQPDGTGTGGYVGFQALFGNIYVAPAINHDKGFVLDLDGNHVTDDFGNDGFPSGFSPKPSQSLGYVAQMLEAGVPVVYFYIEDAHDNHDYPNAPIANYPDGTFGPGEANYVAQLKAYDAAFKKFFARLAADGITKDNTLFVITADENDHFAGSVAKALPAGCDGVHTPCTYPTGAKGEVDADLSPIFATEFGDTTSFSAHFDDAPSIHIKGNPAQTATVTRKLEREAGALIGFDPITGADNHVAQALADQAELKLLHMLSHDANRSPSFILFGNPDYFLEAFGDTTPLCTPATDSKSCFIQSRDFAWNHGDFQKDITTTWLGMVGPGVKEKGRFGEIFTDHTDIRPTILSLAHLKDDYAHDGRVVFEVLREDALPDSLRDNRETLSRLAEAYKQINAPLGRLGLKTLTGISTRALKSHDAGDATYIALEDKIADLTEKRNRIAGEMIAMLENAAFKGREIDEEDAEHLIHQAHELLASID
jgi:arylsulfatase A-like enzyme